MTKHFGQELLDFGQPNLIKCLSEGQVDRKFFSYSVVAPKIVNFVPKRNATYMSGISSLPRHICHYWCSKAIKHQPCWPGVPNMLVTLGAVFPDLTYRPWVSEDVSQTNALEVEPFRMYSCWRCE